jgi:HAD superfamily hydrolase (TIGR01459 family)
MANHDHLVEDCGIQRVTQLEEAQFIFNTSPEAFLRWPKQEQHDFLNTALGLNLPMICVNPDISVIVGSEERLCAGSIARWYENLGGQVVYHGKPFPAVYEKALIKLGVTNKKDVLAIGDALHTDIRGAHNFGLDSLLVQTGIDRHMSLTDLEHSHLKPTYVLSGF